ncbi:MAG TPA: ABC transporter permease [Saprospiraceae bacterium]|nr:ABC transporter permease [Saprospiraceae bacterium]
MLQSFLKIAWRNMIRSKGFSFINIMGLAIGMASSMLILMWIYSEVTYDNFHENRDRIYEAWNRANFSGKLQSWNTTPKILARTVEKDLPEVEQAARVDWNSNFLFSIGDKRITESGNIVDSNFLQIFTFPLLRGEPATVLKEHNSIVLTRSFSKTLFGEEDPMGQTVKIDNNQDFKVTGILDELPKNTRFNFKYLVPWSYKRALGDDDNYWGNNSTRTYVMLRPNASIVTANEKMKVLKPKYDQEDSTWQMFLYPMAKWRLYSSFTDGKEDGGGRIAYVKWFGIIALFILLIACINFMNLSTARSERRAKEVGIRKVVGARKKGLIGQFIGESVLMAVIAGICALLLVSVSLPAFNRLTDKSLNIDFANPYFWILFLGFIAFTGMLAGSYPAFFLSSFQPLKALKGVMNKVNTLVTPRKVLVVLQFTFGIILMICTIIVRQQINYAQQRETGYNKNNLIYHHFTGDITKNYRIIKSELLSSGVASSVAVTSAPITQSWSDGWGQEWEGKDPNDKTDFFRYNEEEDLGETVGLTFVQGRDFDLSQYPTDSTAMIINESALKVMGFENPIGQLVKDNGEEWHIVGVIKDFILTSPYQPTQPMLIYGAKSWFYTLLIKLNHDRSTAENLKMAEAIFKKYNPQYPFEYKFVDEEYAQKFDNEKRTGTLAGLFSALAILISCLGLFGLATYMAESRIKEIGIRKVLGASVMGLASLLTKDFLKLVIVSFAIAAPLAWWAMHHWLQNYPYHTPVRWEVFALTGIISALIAILTVGYQAVKAALTNPVGSIKNE